MPFNPRNSLGDEAQAETIRRRDAKRVWYQEHRAEILAYGREWRAKNKDKQRANYNRRRGDYRERRLMREFGITTATFVAMRTEQNGCCAICREPFSKTPHVDHCHATGMVRALLCADCNLGLGRFRDDPERLTAAIQYLHKYHTPTITLSRTG